MYTQSSIIILTILTFPHVVYSLEINCRLEWVNYDYGNVLPPALVPVASDPDEFYVARIFDRKSNSYQIGSMEGLTGIAFIQDNAYRSYQLLTNPYECLLQWVQVPRNSHRWTPIHAWPAGVYGTNHTSSTKNFVGRTKIASTYFAGNAFTSTGKFIIGNQFLNLLQDPTHRPQLENCQILRSYSPGLELSLTDMDYDFEMPSIDQAYIGTDEIQNNGDTEVTLLVTHSKRMQERFTFTHSNPNDYIFGFGLYMKIIPRVIVWPLPPITLMVELMFNLTATIGLETNTVYEHYTTRETVVSKNITVPPRQGAQVCSMARVINFLKINFNATQTFSGRGMSGNEVYAFLQDNIPDFQGQILGNSVMAVGNNSNSTNHTSQGSIVLSTVVGSEFIVLPLDAMEDCGDIQRAADETTLENRRLWNEIANENKILNAEAANAKKSVPKFLSYKPEVREEDEEYAKNEGIIAKSAKFRFKFQTNSQSKAAAET